VPHDVLAAGVRGFQQWVIDTEKATADIKEEYKNLVHQEFQGADEVERLRSSVALAQKNLNSVEEELKSCKAKDRTRLNRTRKETAQALAECEKTYNERHSGLITLRGRIRDVQTELAKHPDPWVLLLCTEWLCRPTKHADFLTGQIVGQQPELPFNADRVLWVQCARLAILHDRALPDEELRMADGILDGAKVNDVWARMTKSWEVWGPILRSDLDWVKADLAAKLPAPLANVIVVGITQWRTGKSRNLMQDLLDDYPRKGVTVKPRSHGRNQPKELRRALRDTYKLPQVAAAIQSVKGRTGTCVLTLSHDEIKA
jgi:hypothetical protein